MKNKRLLLATGILGLLLQVWLPAPAAGVEGFVIPAIAFSHLTIEPGGWCEYLVIEESMGQQDSSILYIAIPLDVTSSRAGHFWFELMGRPIGSGEREAVIARVLMSEKIKKFSEMDSLGNYVAIIYIKEGEEPAREGDYEALSHLEKVSAGDTASWIPTGEERLETRAGDFSCRTYQRVLSFEKVIPAKGAKLIKMVSDHHQGWFAAGVPLFQMVRYTADRSRDTRMDPPIAGVPVAGARASKTRVELVGFGTGARTKLPMGD